MVFQSVTLFARSRGPDEFWRKRKIFRLSAHFRNRYRNCYSLAVRAVHRSLQFSTKHRDPKRKWIREIWQTRIEAGSIEHGLNYKILKEGLTRCEILLDRKSLAELAVWEPRTFKSLVKIACARLKQDGLKILNLQKAEGVITRGLIK
ncbi:39S ribosomal protein L20, mitochondrial [Nasonia vitripennis]|uniref:Large ribosomal subunit protein bL20m n=1 Tax=Nasonia vitripennis TaxID=7425 RepID=A0A7M7G0R5_NASVI|nr:39S ribosomal protein L20, mitochondrial [Nasonia vitripennis]